MLAEWFADIPEGALWAQLTVESPAPTGHAPWRPLDPGSVYDLPVKVGREFTSISVLFRTFGSTNSGFTLDLVDLSSGTEQTVVSRRFERAIDNVWIELLVGRRAPGSYLVRIHEPTGTIAVAELDSTGEAAWFADEVESVPLESSRESGSLRLATSSGDSVERLEIALTLPWRHSGFSVEATDGVPFDKVYGPCGRYLPAQQLKRIDSWPFDMVDDHELVLSGGGTDLVLAREGGLRMRGSMTESSITLFVSTPERSGTLEVFASIRPSAELPSTFPTFTSSDATRASQLTTMFAERALSWPFIDYTASATGWKHWMARMLSWTFTDGCAAQAKDLLGVTRDPEGWAWTRTDSAGWPFPDPERFDTRHPSASLAYVEATCVHYAWTGDEDFLREMAPRARTAIEYIIERFGVRARGLLVNDIPDQDGRPGSLGSHYWDIVPGGWLDAYSNVYLYSALVQWGGLERALGNLPAADDAEALAGRVRRAFNDTFWNDASGRFVQNIDVDGTVHDYGSSYVNVEAIANGLVDDDRSARILDWLDDGTTELTERLLLVAPRGPAVGVEPGVAMSRSFEVGREFEAVGIVVSAPQSASFSIGLRNDAGTLVAQRSVARWWDTGWVSLDFASMPPGRYAVVLSTTDDGVGWQRGDADSVHADHGAAPVDGSPMMSLAVVSGAVEGPADIYDAWRFAPRATTRRNDFWYTFGWSGVETEFGDQVQDGGTALYISAFDVIARATISADDAWARLCAVLDRWSLPDHLSGGVPLIRGERPQAALPGQVGVDVPFPESGMVPVAFLSAFVGLEAHPTELVVWPRIPTALESVGIRNVAWRGERLDIEATRHDVTVTWSGETRRIARSEHEQVVLSKDVAGRLQSATRAISTEGDGQ